MRYWHYNWMTCKADGRHCDESLNFRKVDTTEESAWQCLHKDNDLYCIWKKTTNSLYTFIWSWAWKVLRLSQVEGMPEEVIFDHLHATAFQYSPLGRTILGPAENIARLTRDDLAKYIKTHYTAPRMVRHTQSHRLSTLCANLIDEKITIWYAYTYLWS